jgi:hypothetical protein
MKSLLSALVALGLFASPLQAQTIAVPTAPVGVGINDEDCDDDYSTETEDDDCIAGFLLLDNGLSNTAVPFALVGAAGLVGFIALAGSNDSTNATTGTGRPVYGE